MQEDCWSGQRAGSGENECLLTFRFAYGFSLGDSLQISLGKSLRFRERKPSAMKYGEMDAQLVPHGGWENLEFDADR